jgi:CO/xanthine dehydrogenase FAD-binding subunit
MKPAPFKYIAAATLEQALALKAEYGDDAKFLAGGQSLMPAMNFRLARPAVLIDINGLEECAGIRPHETGGTGIGALTRYRTLQNDAWLVRTFPLFGEALPHIAHPQIRNRGTIGGNLSHADPASELPALAVAMEAVIVVKAGTHERRIAATDFFQGLLTTDLQPDEMLVEIELPAPKPQTGTCFSEIARRRGDFALAGVAASISVDPDGLCIHTRLTLCGVGETPVDASDVAAAVLVGQRVQAEGLDDIVESVRRMIEPAGNVHATPDYQRHVAGILVQRTLATAYDRACRAA